MWHSSVPKYHINWVLPVLLMIHRLAGTLDSYIIIIFIPKPLGVIIITLFIPPPCRTFIVILIMNSREEGRTFKYNFYLVSLLGTLSLDGCNTKSKLPYFSAISVLSLCHFLYMMQCCAWRLPQRGQRTLCEGFRTLCTGMYPPWSIPMARPSDYSRWVFLWKYVVWEYLMGSHTVLLSDSWYGDYS